MKLNKLFTERYKTEHEVITLGEYLERAKSDPKMYASVHERVLEAIGPCKYVNTDKNLRLKKIFGGRTIKTWDTFSEFYGMEEVIENIVRYFVHASQGLEERKQILYLLGPVGGGKSSLAERIKQLFEKIPFYAIEGSPIYESPLSLFKPEDSSMLGIPKKYLNNQCSPWLVKRLQEWSKDKNFDYTKIPVVKLYPSQLQQIAISKVEPGDENNQDITSLVGKLDIRKLEHYRQDDPDAYCYNGGLCLGNRGILEFVEMFKAPIKVLHPLLTATQEGNYKGSEALAPVPFEGVIFSHSNESEWLAFKNNKNNEAFLDRVYLVKVPYCLRTTDETSIYKKLIENSELKDAVCAPYTLNLLSQYSVLTRLDDASSSSVYTKLKVYDGQDLKDKEVDAKPYDEYKALATLNEGMYGYSTRQAYKLLAKVFNYDNEEISANPVHLLLELEKDILSDDIPENLKNERLAHLKHLKHEYLYMLEKEIQIAYLDSYYEYGQHLFDRYILYADYWLSDETYRDSMGLLMDRSKLNQELEKIEKPARIGNAKDFRHEVVGHCLRYQAKNGGKNPKWTEYEKLKEVIESNVFSSTEELLPLLSLTKQGTKEETDKISNFLKKMEEQGYTKKQVSLLIEWWLRAKKSQ